MERVLISHDGVYASGARGRGTRARASLLTDVVPSQRCGPPRATAGLIADGHAPAAAHVAGPGMWCASSPTRASARRCPAVPRRERGQRTRAQAATATPQWGLRLISVGHQPERSAPASVCFCQSTFDALAYRYRSWVTEICDESQRLRPVPTGLLRVFAEYGRGQAIQGQGLVPLIAEIAVRRGSLAVEVGRLGRTPEPAVHLTNPLPGQCLAAAVGEASVECGGTLVGGQGLGVLAPRRERASPRRSPRSRRIVSAFSWDSRLSV